MCKITGDEPANPIKEQPVSYQLPDGSKRIDVGLSIRQEFAAKAMQGLLSDVETQRWIQEDKRFTGNNFAEVVGLNCVEFADNLINALNTIPNPNK